MASKSKQLSNPYSTGGGGSHFEVTVQAQFVTLMLTGGFAPCLPQWPISKIKLQGKFAGYDTDDLIIFVENPDTSQERKILGQIKHSINITKNDKEFGVVIQAAWSDFNNYNLFSTGEDALALITGPLRATDINDTRTILEWARHAENADEFIKKVELARFSNPQKQSKLQAFKSNLKNANNGNHISDEILFEFLNHFHLLGYDLDIKAGVTLSLLHSLLGQYSQENAASLWARIVEEVQYANENAGTITRESIADDLRDTFKQRAYEVLLNELAPNRGTSKQPTWNQHEFASDLAVINLIGSWNENNDADLAVIRQLTNEDYSSWIIKIRETMQQPASPIALKNGKWRITDRKALWQALGSKLFDDNLDRFKVSIVNVLTEQDPQFELPVEKRYAAGIHGKLLKYSPEIRKGLAESLALLGIKPDVLTNCSHDKAEYIAVIAVREIFENADWVLWGGLNNLLPTLAEAAPNEFLNSVEHALQQSPCPFDILVAQEGIGIGGRNYLTGLLWGLETLAWEEKHLVRVCVILGELASHDPGGNWSNRPSNSLTTILLPWLPQTTAPIEKRKAVLINLRNEVPAVAWKLILSLLPNPRKISMGTHKPSWRNIIPDDWEPRATSVEYWEQASYYSDLAVSMAIQEIEKLNELIGYLDTLPQKSIDNLLEYISSEEVSSKSEHERLALWTGLIEILAKHQRFSDSKWVLNSETISQIEMVVAKLAPTNPLNLHRILFSDNSFDFIEKDESLEELAKKLVVRRHQALKDILEHSGIEGIIQFAEAVERPSFIGHSLCDNANQETDAGILPALLETENEKLAQFTRGYVGCRQQVNGWEWVDGLDKSGWSDTQKGQFLSYLPFTSETWARAKSWLSDSEGDYWLKTSANPYQAQSGLGPAIDKLVHYGRPNAAIDCLHKMVLDEQPLDKTQSVEALLAAVSSKDSSSSINSHHILKIIKALQDDPDTDPGDIIQVEWAYLPLLDGLRGASPKYLEARLATVPEFYCELIQLVYRSSKKDKSKKNPSKQEKSIATNAFGLLYEWKTPPGMQPDGSFSRNTFLKWLEYVKEKCAESGHLEVAHTHIGHVLVYCPPDPQGLWIDQTVANALNAKDAEDMRTGFHIELFNSRGFEWIDPTGKPELELAALYKQKAEEIENFGYHRLALTLRDLSDSYLRDAGRIADEYSGEDAEDS